MSAGESCRIGVGLALERLCVMHAAELEGQDKLSILDVSKFHLESQMPDMEL